MWVYIVIGSASESGSESVFTKSIANPDADSERFHIGAIFGTDDLARYNAD